MPATASRSLSPARDNAILLLHALSGDAHAAGRLSAEDRRAGWWDSFIGPGRPFDTDRAAEIARTLLAEAGEDPALRVSLAPDPTAQTGLMGCEVLYAFRREMAETLADALLRRTMAGLGPNVALDVDEAAANVAVAHLGWTEERAKEEVENFRRYVERYRPKSMR